MTALAETSLAADERALVEGFVGRLRAQLKDELHAVWLFGSRGRPPRAANECWAPGPARPRLADGSVHVWRADLDAVGQEIGELLCDQEHARARRIQGGRERHRWTRSRGVLRALLGRYLEQDPHALRFVLGPHGKPALACAGLSFNLSHSGRLALYAFARAGAVGVDVELARRQPSGARQVSDARRPVNELALAKRAFGPLEARHLEGLDRAQREREFLRAWARNEAQLKLSGTGIAGAGVSGGAARDEHDMWTAELDVARHAAAALVLEHEPRELRRWDWHG